MSEFLSLKNIEKRFPIPGKEDYIAVTDVNLEIKKNEVKDPEKLLPELKNLVTVYTQQINFRESTLDGTICKYRIRQGMLFLIIKKVVKAAELKWVDWYEQNFNGSEAVQPWLHITP